MYLGLGVSSLDFRLNISVLILGSSEDLLTFLSYATLPVPTVLVYSRYSCVVMSSAWIKQQLMLGFHSVRIPYCRGASPWVSKESGQEDSQDQITSQRSYKHFLGGSKELSTSATRSWLGGDPDPALTLPRAKPGQVPTCVSSPPLTKTKPNPQFQHPTKTKMAAATPSYLTMSYEGSQGDREFVFSCKGRPFSVLTAPNFPTPPSTMVDYNLVRDLKLRITDLQCAKLVYAGQKFRILGRVSTSVQCIFDGAPAGNTHFKALVVQDLYQNLDTHSIAGQKLSDKLKGPPYELLSEPEENKTLTEPTKKIQKPSLEPSKSRKRKKVK